MIKNNNSFERWTIENSIDTYGIQSWGAGYFNISEKGEVIVTPEGKNTGPEVSLMDIISGIRARGMHMPVLLRFENILDSQIKLLHDSFNTAIKDFGYKGKYRGVYPIKVNQQQQIVEEITRYGQHFNHGLEAGSKAELIAAISLMKDLDACLVCNGYKDEEYIDLGLYARKMGIKCFFVIERPSELPIILERSRKLNVQPLIGARIKISTTPGGHWSESAGDRSVFGLNMSQLVKILDILREENMLDTFQMLHYHIGSQVPNIRDIRSALVEACRIYSDLVQEGAAMGYLNIGGGLAVDYDGSQTNFTSSRNYTLPEYCTDIIEVVMKSLDESKVQHPTIITESGRATVAYCSVLLFNVLDVSSLQSLKMPEKLPENTHSFLKNLMEVSKGLNSKNIQEAYHDAVYYRDEIRQLFKHGNISLRERALAESIFWDFVQSIAREIKKCKYIPDEFEKIDVSLADIFYCNFSVFQSLPDAWAIDQLFPIMPVHRLQDAPTRQAILSDITCDCDGKIVKFIDLHDVKNTLPLHEFNPGEEYYLGVFLIGAYQETLGDLHNLLGDTNVINIRVSETGDYKFVTEIKGDSVEDVLSYVEYDTEDIISRIRAMAEEAIRNNRIAVQDRRDIMEAFEAGIRGYTYFER